MLCLMSRRIIGHGKVVALKFDDFQDGYSRLRRSEELPSLSDTLELWLLPMILGMFGVWMGIDQMLVAARIPGRWGFARYVCYGNIGEPWNAVLNALYEILGFLLANVVASGARGLGWILYTAGSVVGSLLMNFALSQVFPLVFS